MRKPSLTASLKARGFDKSHPIPFERGAHVGCSQCQALSINGVPCHERGCPNIVATCRECGNLDPDRTCCQWDEEDAISAAEAEVEEGQARWAETGSTRKH